MLTSSTTPDDMISFTSSGSPSVTTSCRSTSGWKLTERLLSPKSSLLLLLLDKSTMEGFLGLILRSSIGVSLSAEQNSNSHAAHAEHRPQGTLLLDFVFSAVMCMVSSLELLADEGLGSEAVPGVLGKMACVIPSWSTLVERVRRGAAAGIPLANMRSDCCCSLLLFSTGLLTRLGLLVDSLCLKERSSSSSLKSSSKRVDSSRTVVSLEILYLCS